MKIGIDLDNVIANFDDVLLDEYIKHDKELRNTGIVNEKANCICKDMFDWTEEEEKSFYYSNIERIANKLEPIKDAPKYIKKLKEDENEIYIFSGRNNGEYTKPYEDTKNWLNKYNIPYDHLILTNSNQKHEKAEECLKNNVNILIDDSPKTCIEAINRGIKVYTMNTRFNQKEQGLDRVSCWKEIYEKISQLYRAEETEVNYLNVDEIYKDLFKKLGE